jgi:hypothetical protein
VAQAVRANCLAIQTPILLKKEKLTGRNYREVHVQQAGLSSSSFHTNTGPLCILTPKYKYFLYYY